jgi:hypothetical protein
MFLRIKNEQTIFCGHKNFTEIAFVTQRYSNGFDELCGLRQIAL